MTVLIADDHDLFAASLEALLGTDDEIDVVGRASNGEEAMRLASETKPDVVLMDISMPGRRRLRRRAADPRRAARDLRPLPHRLELADRRGRGARVRRGRLRDEGQDRVRPARRRSGRSTPAQASYPFAPWSAFSQPFRSSSRSSWSCSCSCTRAATRASGGMGFTPASQGGHAHRRAEPDPAHRGRRGALRGQLARAVQRALE